VRTVPRATHIVYCYTPARWLYTPDEYLAAGLAPALFAPLRAALHRWDRRAAGRADHYIAISEHVRDRIRRVYGIDAEVVYPPVEVDRFTPTPRGERLLVVSRLLAYKRVDLVVRAATQLSVGLDVVGTGPALDSLRAVAGPTVTFHGRLHDAAITELFEHCAALCLPGAEDFGITPVEANAAGKPVVAYGAGGALETVVDGRSGVFFCDQRVEALIEAIRRVDALATPPTELAQLAARFSATVFKARLSDVVGRLVKRGS
jgi:glycosyltransferase involved in cell wall biosynthesis